MRPCTCPTCQFSRQLPFSTSGRSYTDHVVCLHDVHRLDLLRELAERGSVTAVAEATGRTPSAVSQQLKVLEREAGMPLTERSGRGIVLTSAGHALARSALDVAIALERASALWDQFRNHPSGEVSLLTFPTMGATLLPHVLTDLASVAGL